MIPQIIVLCKLIFQNISIFIAISIIGVIWIIRDKKILDEVLSIILIWGLLWIIFTNKLIEKIVVVKEENKINNIIIIGCHVIILMYSIISLNKLIVGGAEIFTDVNINHQNVMLGNDVIIPLKDRMFRVWNFVYIILTNKNKAEEDSPWATIIIIAPFLPIIDRVNNLARISPIWATDE